MTLVPHLDLSCTLMFATVTCYTYSIALFRRSLCTGQAVVRTFRPSAVLCSIHQMINKYITSGCPIYGRFWLGFHVILDSSHIKVRSFDECDTWASHLPLSNMRRQLSKMKQSTSFESGFWPLGLTNVMVSSHWENQRFLASNVYWTFQRNWGVHRR